MKRWYLVAVLLIPTSFTDAYAATRTWTGNGADNRFSTVQNWAEGIVPDTGDDLIFPAVSNQYSLFDDILPDRVLHSVTFQGGNYTCNGGSKTQIMTVSAGTQNLGTTLWQLHSQLFVEAGASLSITIFGRDSNFTIDGGGTSNIAVQGSFGAVIRKQGAGLANVNLEGTIGTGGSITVNGGTVVVTPQHLSGSNGPTVVNSGSFRTTAQFFTSALTVTGSNSEIAANNLVTNRLEISNGAKLSINSCNAFLQGNPVILTGAVLQLDNFTCNGTRSEYIIYNPSAGQVTGSFVNYPHGAVVFVGGRRFRMTYRGGNGNDVQVLPYTPFDFDGNGSADIAVYRPSTGWWYLNGQSVLPLGPPGDRPVPGRYVGLVEFNQAVWGPSNGLWHAGGQYIWFGTSGDLPVPSDYDGDLVTDIAVFRPSNGFWYRLNSSDGTFVAIPFGLSEDKPTLGDFDNDGKTDIAVFRPSNSFWYRLNSSDGSFSAAKFGLPGDIRTPEDYDGDGQTDLAVYRPSDGFWYVSRSRDGFLALPFGLATDIPVPADYDGDGKADISVFRPSNGFWYRLNSTDNSIFFTQWGLEGDVPVPSAFIY